MADAQSNIKVSIDTTDALASIKNLQRQISAFHTSMAKGGAAANAVTAQMQQSLINSVNATGKFSAQMRTIKTTTESFTDSLEKNKFSLGEYFRYAGGASKSFGKLFKTEFDTINKVARENVKDLQTQYIKMGRDANGSMKAIAVRPLSLDMKDLATKTMIASEKQALLNQLLKQGSTNLLNFGKNTQWAGRQLMVGFTIPLITLGSAASKTFMDMETQAIRFKKVYGDLFTPKEETAKALEEITNLGKEFTKYGIAVSATVGLASEAAAAGFKGLDLQRQTAAATKLSILGQVESQKALETTIALQNAFSMSSADLATNIDFLNAVENQTVLSLDDMSTAIPKAAPVIQQLGGDVKDLAFFMTAMKEGGINASEGANALKSGLASLINPTGKANDLLLSFGINTKNIVESNRGDLKKTVIDFATALNQLDPLNRAQAIEQMFGKFQFARLSTLFANVTKEGTQAARVLDLAGSSIQDLAALSEKELGMTSESAMNKFKASVENLKLSLVPVGEEFLKAVTPIAQFVTRILDGFNNLGDGTKKVIVTLTAIVAGLGPVLLMTFGLLANGLANIIKGFTAVKTLFNKTGQSSATLGTEVKYMTIEQRNAAAVAASLDQVHRTLAQTFTSEAGAVDALTRAYQRAIATQAQFMPTSVPLPRGPIKKRAKGKPAVVGGTGNKDSELSLLMPGETVIPTDMSEKYGSLINGMIDDSIPGYEVGKKNASVYGGQTLDYSGLGVFGPGNNSGSTLGLDRNFFLEGGDFEKSMIASAVGGGFTLDNPSGRMTKGATEEYAAAIDGDMPKVVTALRETVISMEKTGENIGSIEDVTAKAKPKLQAIFDEMEQRGGKAASSAKAVRDHMFYPGDSEMGGTYGETRAPGARQSTSKPGVVKGTMYRTKKSIFQSRVRSAYRNLTGQNPEGTYAHLNESRKLGEEVPLRGSGMDLPESQKAPLVASVTAKGKRLREDFAGGGIVKRKSNAEKAAVRQSGAIDQGEYVKGMKSVAALDPYKQTQDRNSPHPEAAKDGKDDAKSYSKARDKELKKQSGRRVSTRAQGPAPIGPDMPVGATQLGIVAKPTAEEIRRDKKQKRRANLKNKAVSVGSKVNSLGGGMGLLGANMALSMSPDFAGKGQVQSAMTGANLGMMFGPWGMAAGASIGLVTSAFSALIEKQRQYEAMANATFKSSADLATFFGNAVVDTELRVGSFTSSLGIAGKAAENLGKSFGYTNSELKTFIDLIASLPENNPLKEVVDGLANEKNPEQINKIAKAFITTQVAIGQIQPEQAQKTLDLMLSASGHADMVGSSFMNLKTQSDAVSISLKNASNNSVTLGTTLTQIVGAASNATSLEQLILMINGIAASGISAAAALSSMYYAYLQVGNLEAAGAVQALGKVAGITADQSALVLTAATKGFEVELNALTNAKKLEASAKKFLDDPKVWNKDNTTASTKDYQSEKQIGSLKAEIKLLEKKKKIIDDQLKKERAISDELKKQNDYREKQANLDKQIVEAKIRGNYIEAANLMQQKQNNTVEYNQESRNSALQAQADALQAKIDKLKESSDATVSAINGTTGAVTAGAASIVSKLGSIKWTGPDGSKKSQAVPINTSQESLSAYIKANKLTQKAASGTRVARTMPLPTSAFDAAEAFKSDKAKDLLEAYVRTQIQIPEDKESVIVSVVGSDGQTYKFNLKKNGDFIRVAENKGKARGGLIKKYATGGLIKGPGTGTSDSITASLGYAGGGGIQVSNGEFVVKASSVKDYGLGNMNAINNGTATVSTNSGSTVYNINMPITSNASDPKIVGDYVIKQLKLVVDKNNKTNSVKM
jgi:TP901 family phage tail tape measure protein